MSVNYTLNRKELVMMKKEERMCILDKEEVRVLNQMALYWREVLKRDEAITDRIIASELGSVANLLGAKKVLRIIMVYVNRIIDEE